MHAFKRVAVITANNSPDQRYLIKLFRSEFNNVFVASLVPPKRKQNGLRDAFAVIWKPLWLSIKKLMLSYDYSIAPLITSTPSVDCETLDIKSRKLKDALIEFRPDVICMSGTNNVSDEITSIAPFILKIHNGFTPYYRDASSANWVSIESNYSYLSYTIYEAKSTIDVGHVYSSRPVLPYFFESFEDHQYRQSIYAVKALLGIVKNIAAGKVKSFKQPDAGARNSRYNNKPDMFVQKAADNFGSKNGVLYKYTMPRTGRFEKFLVKRFAPKLATKISNGWFIVNYHAIIDRPDFDVAGLPGIVTQLDKFKRHLNIFSNEFQFVSLSEGLAHLESGAAEKNSYISITIDDSLRLPDQVITMFQSEGVIPTLFLNTDPLIRRIPLHNHMKYLERLFFHTGIRQSFEDWVQSQYLSVDDVRYLLDHGVVEIGSHTASHPRLDHIRVDDIKKEVTGAHEELERILQSEIDYFAFPFGGLNDRSFLAEYEAMKTSRYYFACSGGVNRKYLPGAFLRIGVHNESELDLENLLRTQYVR